MNKAILITDMPSTCAYCDFCHTKEYDDGGEEFCGILNEDVEVYYYHGDGRPELCPLKEIPAKIPKEDPIEINDYDWGFRRGWNDCIDEILGE